MLITRSLGRNASHLKAAGTVWSHRAHTHTPKNNVFPFADDNLRRKWRVMRLAREWQTVRSTELYVMHVGRPGCVISIKTASIDPYVS